MSTSCFSNPTKPPTDEDLTSNLGPVYPLWMDLRTYLADRCGTVEIEWTYYGKKIGWLAKHMVKQRNYFFMLPLKDGLRIAMTFGEKAIEEIEKRGLPQKLIAQLEKSRKYAEGRTVQIPIEKQADCDNAYKLIDVKCGH